MPWNMKPTLKQFVPQHLEEWRKLRKLTRPQAAKAIMAAFPAREKIDQATIAKWENGETAVRMMDCFMLAFIYRLPHPGWLFDDPEEHACTG